MKRMQLPVGVIIAGYGSLLLVIAFFFLIQDSSLHQLQDSFPFPFIFRFFTFWFISFVVAVVIFMLSMKHRYLAVSMTNKVQWLWLIAFCLGALVVLLTAIAFMFL